MDPEQRTFAHFLQDAGYRTAAVGKWQLYGSERQRQLAGRGGSLPEEMGFDEYCLWQVKERGSRYRNPRIVRNGEPAREYPDDFGPDVFLKFIEEFLERNADGPFLLYYPMVLTHAPFRPTPYNPEYHATGPERNTEDVRYFQDYVFYMDRTVGRIADTLERLRLRERTLLLFTGDNGTDRRIVSRMGDRSVQGEKGYTTEAGTHVPLIASWPGKIRPGVNQQLIDSTDFLPTLLEAAHVSIPRGEITDGLSFYPQLIGQEAPAREWIFCDYDPRWGSFPARRYVQNKEWKLYGDGGFFQVSVDSAEQRPLDETELTVEGNRIRQEFQEVLDRMVR
jgi:arylsulfatase A-like enzyme